MHAGVVLRNHANTHFLRVTRPFPLEKWLFLRGLAMSSVSTLVDQLKTAEGEALQKLLYALAELLDKASGDTSDALRSELRKIGAVAVISKLLTHEAKQIHQLAINIAGSLAATALDPQAGLSNSLLKQAGAFDHLLRHLLTTKDDTTLLYALIAIQNMCVEIEYVNELKAAGGVKRLQHIAGQTDPQLRQFAQGCLDNARTVVAIDAMQQKAVKSTPKTRAEAGKYLAHAYVRRWRARRATALTGASDLSAGVDASFSPANTIHDQRQHAHTVTAAAVAGSITPGGDGGGGGVGSGGGTSSTVVVEDLQDVSDPVSDPGAVFDAILSSTSATETRTISEVANYLISQCAMKLALVPRVLQIIDVNGDGIIDRDEFIKAHEAGIFASNGIQAAWTAAATEGRLTVSDHIAQTERKFE